MLGKLPKKIYYHFPALQYKNYRLYFFGQLISFTGSWLHGVAHGWLVYQLTHSAFWLGTISAVSALPVLFLTLYGGFLVDKYNRKKLLMLTQFSSLLLALILGILTITHTITIPILLILTFLSGVANAIDNPVTQAFVVDVVEKNELPSAIGLNATMFNTGRVLGPAAAGFLIALVGIGNIFLINAASFLAILGSLYFIKITRTKNSQSDKPPLNAIKEGLIYSRSHPVIRILLLTAGIGAIFCFSQATIMPSIVEKIFQEGSVGLGRLLSAMGLGALIASLLISSRFKNISAFWLIGGGNVLFIFSTLLFTFTTNISLASIFLFFSGLGLTLQFSSLYATIQRLVSEEFRGRVSSMYVLLFIGFSPIGNLFIGTTASWLGPQSAIRLSLVAATLYSLCMFAYLPKVKRKYHVYRKQNSSLYAFADTD